jgi:hypothetical protein
VLDSNAYDRSEISTVAEKMARLLREFEIYVSDQSHLIIDYATARRCEEPISMAITESTVPRSAWTTAMRGRQAMAMEVSLAIRLDAEVPA